MPSGTASQPTLTAMQISILAIYGAVLWFLAAMLVRTIGPMGALDGVSGIIVYALVIPGTVPAIIAARPLAKLRRDQTAVGITVVTATALLLDGVAHAGFPAIYGTDPALIIKGAAAIFWGAGYFFWDAALVTVRAQLEGLDMVNTMIRWLEGLGLSNLRIVLAPVVVLFLAIPVIVITSLLFVAWLMTPAMVALVAERRFAALERKKGGSVVASVFWSISSTLLAVIAMLVSIPLWLIPPLILVLPPLIWGWLTYRVMSYDALVDHASPEERRQIFKDHRTNLLSIGVISGYLGAAPSVLWASGAMFIAMAPILVPVAIWMYTLVFAFSSLWFAHYTLAALEQIRKKNTAQAHVSSAVSAIETVANTSPSPPVPPALPSLPAVPPVPPSSPSS